MAGLLTVSSVLMCPHGGMVTITSANTRTRAAGAFVARPSDTFTITGCPLNISGAPHPCVRVQWVVPAARSKVTGDSTLTDASVGLCIAGDGAPQGAVIVSFTQPRVTGI